MSPGPERICESHGTAISALTVGYLVSGKMNLVVRLFRLFGIVQQLLGQSASFNLQMVVKLVVYACQHVGYRSWRIR